MIGIYLHLVLIVAEGAKAQALEVNSHEGRFALVGTACHEQHEGIMNWRMKAQKHKSTKAHKTKSSKHTHAHTHL